jgi:hypothetical protein
VIDVARGADQHGTRPSAIGRKPIAA